MTLANTLKFLEPTTLEVKMAFLGIATGALSALVLQNSSLLWAVPLSITTPLYSLFRITEYRLRNEERKNPNRPKKLFQNTLQR